jgi:hypothetical protein
VGRVVQSFSDCLSSPASRVLGTMSRSTLVHHDVGDAGRPAPDLQAFEGLQAELLDLLARRAGFPVSYVELRDAGIEFPASVASELELSGVPIERCRAHPGAAVAGLRLDPAWLEACAPSTTSQMGPRLGDRLSVTAPQDGNELAGMAKGVGAWVVEELRSAARDGSALVGRLSERTLLAWGSARRTMIGIRSHRPVFGGRQQPVARREAGLARARAVIQDALRPRRLVPAALLAVFSVLVTLAVVDLRHGGGGPRETSIRQPSAAGARGRARENAASPSSGSSAPQTSLVPISPELAIQLEARGHEQLEAGRYAQAPTLLAQALKATGKDLEECIEPTSEACLTYAYALYDLGRALVLDGRPGAGVAVLERRLQIDNQRPTVLAELERARAQPG